MIVTWAAWNPTECQSMETLRQSQQTRAFCKSSCKSCIVQRKCKVTTKERLLAEDQISDNRDHHNMLVQTLDCFRKLLRIGQSERHLLPRILQETAPVIRSISQQDAHTHLHAGSSLPRLLHAQQLTSFVDDSFEDARVCAMLYEPGRQRGISSAADRNQPPRPLCRPSGRHSAGSARHLTVASTLCRL